MKDISQLIARRLLKVNNQEEDNHLTEWEKKSDQNATFVKKMETFWNLPLETTPDKKASNVRDRLLTRINNIEKTKSRNPFVYYLSRIAAVLIFTVAIAGLTTYFYGKTMLPPQNNWVEVSTESGQQSKVTLPDGSFVWLNAQTDIKYHLEKNVRKVTLIGEAYFEVTHKKNQPFVVETSETKIRVLGTKFNVSHYPESKLTEASLLSGSIAMSIVGNNDEVKLKPGEKLTYFSDQKSFQKSTVDVENDILWKQGILYFNNESFNNLIKKLERHYAVEFIYNSASFEDIHYTGKVNNLSINKVMEFIQLTIPLNYTIENKTIKIYAEVNGK